MNTVRELLALIAAIIVVFGGLALIYFWIRAVAKWVWLLTIRRWLVIGVTFVTLLPVVVLLQLVAGLDMLTSLGFLIGLVASPIMAVPLADYVAFRFSSHTRRDGQSWRNFIFDDKRRRQSEDYSAPSSDP